MKSAAIVEYRNDGTFEIMEAELVELVGAGQSPVAEYVAPSANSNGVCPNSICGTDVVCGNSACVGVNGYCGKNYLCVDVACLL